MERGKKGHHAPPDLAASRSHDATLSGHRAASGGRAVVPAEGARRRQACTRVHNARGAARVGRGGAAARACSRGGGQDWQIGVVSPIPPLFPRCHSPGPPAGEAASGAAAAAAAASRARKAGRRMVCGRGRGWCRGRGRGEGLAGVSLSARARARSPFFSSSVTFNFGVAAPAPEKKASPPQPVPGRL